MSDHTTNESTDEIPYGCCHCGCGQKTTIATSDNLRYSHIKGQPKKYLKGHHFRKPSEIAEPNPSGFCMCGCGQKTRIAEYNDITHGHVRGAHIRFVEGHTYRLPKSTEKCCTKCKNRLPVTVEFFYKDKTMSDGFSSRCKSCMKEAGKKRRKLYYQSNKEIIAQKARLYGVKNRGKISEKQRESRAKKKDQITEYNRRWRAANKEILKAHKRRRRALKLKSEGHHTTEDIEALYASQDGKCCYCGCDLNGKFHVDHVIPLTRGGSDAADNIAIACAFCNQSKKDKLLSEWKGSSRMLKGDPFHCPSVKASTNATKSSQ